MVGQPPHEGRFRWAVDFSIEGDLRFLSHRDVIRLFSRALSRAGLAVSMSRGFNPRPRLSFPLPRPVGIASRAERLVLELSEPIPAEVLAQKLAAQMPEALRIRSAMALQAADRSQPQAVSYLIRLQPSERDLVERQIPCFMSETKILIERANPDERQFRTVNIRPFVRGLHLAEEALRIDLWVANEGGARPSEVCQALGLAADGMNARLVRTEIIWD